MHLLINDLERYSSNFNELSSFLKAANKNTFNRRNKPLIVNGLYYLISHETQHDSTLVKSLGGKTCFSRVVERKWLKTSGKFDKISQKCT